MKSQIIIALILIFAITINYSCNKRDDETMEEENSCPETNTSVPEILGDWIFTGTSVDGQLLIEDCDLKTKLTVTESQFIWDNYSGSGCNELTVIPTCYSVENNTVFYYDDFGEKTGFSQKIKTLNSTTLILENNSTSTIVATENYERMN
ncbi:hypothetical protein EYD45_04325 [Hyunsoonleella flava]|uniref:Lipocalin-like domain-containing protein n=1 Tax=Hyunsoonleella flava TaxID=2527939 RepID=A0A4Q9FGX7_9FLAO|nr:hypothetical protein [Hyunsoonleella flava]TBN05510.1 hypothetical protein EYD45_04325 [Hyunsoonleella flava]